MKFRVQNLLSLEDGKLRGAMSPMLFAQEMCKQVELPLDGLLRVWFDDEEYHNVYEGPGRKQGLTGYDTLVVVSRYSNDQHYAMFVDSGIGGVPAFLWIASEDKVTETPIYTSQEYEKKLTQDEALEILKAAKVAFDKWYNETFPGK